MVFLSGGWSWFLRPVGHIIALVASSLYLYCYPIYYITPGIFCSDTHILLSFLHLAIMVILLITLYYTFYQIYLVNTKSSAWAVLRTTVRETAAMVDPVIRVFYGRVETRQAPLWRWESLFKFTPINARLNCGSPTTVGYWSAHHFFLTMSRLG